VAVIGVPDQQFQEIGYAVYSAEEPIKSDVLRQICRKNLANYKVPKKFFWMKDIPLLPVGKVDKTRLKKMLLNGNHPSLIEC
jgi:acyl-CoA synthetase (AMP-forming)/AMP-acid ligase II